ncbi:MAG: prolyl oligopeptidase family serine peptidase [Candidatus Aminicenantia bacterium]
MKGLIKSKSFILALFILFSISYAVEETPKYLTVNDILDIKNVTETQISPDGKWILYVVSEADFEQNLYNSDIWRVSAEGGEPVKMTNSPKVDYSPRWSPDGKKIAFISGREEKNQVWIINPFGGEAERLTNSKTGVKSFEWFPDSQKIAYLAADPPTEEEEKKKKEKDDAYLVDKDFKMTHIWVIDLEKKEEKKITSGNFDVINFSISPDGKNITFASRPTPKVPDYFNSDIFIVSSSGGEIKDIVVREGVDTNPRWSPDGQKLAFISNNRGDWISNTYLCLVDLETKEIKTISQEFDERINAFWWDDQGKYLYFNTNKRIYRHLFKISVEEGKAQQLTPDDGYYSSFSFNQNFKWMSFIKQNPLSPHDVYLSLVKKFIPRRLTEINPQIKNFVLGKTEIIHWRSSDGMEMEGLLVKPVNYTEGKKYPLLVIVHGGPAGVFSYRFLPRRSAYPIQTMAGLGYAIFMPNPQGSGGYGENFRRANIRDWGFGDYQDIMTGINYLIDLGIADPEKLGIMGWSYGGYMTSWVITQTDRFKAASVGAGVTNAYSFYGQTDIPEFMENYFGAQPWQDIEEYEKHSAMFHIQKARTPTLIQHGEKDLRVPLPQGQELYLGLKKNNVPVEFVIYPRQGHSIREPKLRRDSMERNIKWFNKWILQTEERD